MSYFNTLLEYQGYIYFGLGLVALYFIKEEIVANLRGRKQRKKMAEYERRNDRNLTTKS